MRSKPLARSSDRHGELRAQKVAEFNIRFAGPFVAVIEPSETRARVIRRGVRTRVPLKTAEL